MEKKIVIVDYERDNEQDYEFDINGNLRVFNGFKRFLKKVIFLLFRLDKALQQTVINSLTFQRFIIV